MAFEWKEIPSKSKFFPLTDVSVEGKLLDIFLTPQVRFVCCVFSQVTELGEHGIVLPRQRTEQGKNRVSLLPNTCNLAGQGLIFV